MLLIPAHHKSATPQAMLEIIVCSSLTAQVPHSCSHMQPLSCWSGLEQHLQQWCFPECLEDLMLHTGTLQECPFSGFKNIINRVSSGLSQMLSADGKWDSNCYFTESCLEMQQVIPALILRCTWHSDPFSPTLFLISSFFFEQGLLSLMAVCANESAQNQTNLMFWLQPCLTPVFYNQVLHRNFE